MSHSDHILFNSQKVRAEFWVTHVATDLLTYSCSAPPCLALGWRASASREWEAGGRETDFSEILLVLATPLLPLPTPHPSSSLRTLFTLLLDSTCLPGGLQALASDEETAALQRLFNHLSRLCKVESHLPSPSLSHTHAHTHTHRVLPSGSTSLTKLLRTHDYFILLNYYGNASIIQLFPCWRIFRRFYFVTFINYAIRSTLLETSQAVHWLRLRTSTAGGTGSIPGWGTKVLQDIQCGRKKRKKKTVLAVYLFSNILLSKDPSMWFVTIIWLRHL